MKKLFSILFVVTILLSTSQTYAQKNDSGGIVEKAKVYYYSVATPKNYVEFKTEKITKTLKDSLEDKVDFIQWEIKNINITIASIEKTLLSNIDYEKEYNINLLNNFKQHLKLKIKELKQVKRNINKIEKGKLKNYPIKYYIFIENNLGRTIIDYNCKTQLFTII